MFKFQDLPYPSNALEPVLSQKAVDVHYEKHHRKYYDNLKAMIDGTSLENESLTDIVKTTKNPYIFNNAAQIFNHDFFWKSLAPTGEKVPMSSEVEGVIKIAYGSIEAFKELFIDRAGRHFGSGWCWFVMANDEADIWVMHDAETPIITEGVRPLFCIDVWEHAYYVDYMNDRKTYLEKVFELINWKFVEDNLSK